jgi:hypothetical protein
MRQAATATLLAVTAAFIVATPARAAGGAQHEDAQIAPRLPAEIFGHHWCFFSPPEDDPDLIISADSFDDCANRGGVRFWQRGGKSGFRLGRFEWRANCEIRKIDLVSPKVYRVHGYCRTDGGAMVFEIWQSKTGMHWRELEDQK